MTDLKLHKSRVELTVYELDYLAAMLSDENERDRLAEEIMEFEPMTMDEARAQADALQKKIAHMYAEKLK